jgi:hypothetical protein
MEDEFLVYLQQKYDRNLITSFDHTDLLLWGIRTDDEVNLLGLTLNIGVSKLDEKPYLDNRKIRNIIQISRKLARKCNKPFLQ